MLPLYLMSIEFDEPSDKEKFIYLYEKYKDLMYHVAYDILNDSHLAEDAVQDAFLSVTKCLQKIHNLNCNKTRNYLIIIVRNASYRIYNSQKHFIPIDEEDEDELLSVDGLELIRSKEEFDRIFEKIKSMKTNYSDVILLKYYYGFDDKDIAMSLNISSENVRVRLHRAKNKLKKLLMEDMQDDE